MVKVSNDLLLAANSGQYSILILLDLSSFFNTVDHGVLISRLKNFVGINDVALDWFISYLSNRSFSVTYGDTSSSSAPLICGVPQGSILGPLLFTIYMLPLGLIICKCDINFHCHADDTQLYVQLKPGSADVLRIISCLVEIKNWMCDNFLQLNDSKSEVIIITPSGPSTTSINSLSSGEPIKRGGLITFWN